MGKTTFKWQKVDCGRLRPGWGEGWPADGRWISRVMEMLYVFMGQGDRWVYTLVTIH